MPASANANDTWPNGLKKILGEIAQLSTLQDADLNFANELQSHIVGHLRQGLSTAFGQFVDPNVGPPALGPSQQQMGPPPGTMTGGATQGLSPGMPAVSELSRMLGNTGAVQ